MKSNKVVGALALFFIAFGCQQDDSLNRLERMDDSPIFMDLPASPNGRVASSPIRIYSAEYITAQGSEKVGRTIYFNNVGNKQLAHDFVPGFSYDGTDNISYYIDANRTSQTVEAAKSSQAIARAMQTWDGVTCSELGLNEVPYDGRTTGYVSYAYNFGGSTEYVADVVHAGWLPAEFFNEIAPDGSEYILAATFTLIFFDENGVPTDIDNNGKADVAWREIYYNDAFVWADAEAGGVDVETIALHEAGHGLSQGHFGTAFLNRGTGYAQFAPRAVMNAAYSGIQTQIMATDNGGHCSIWSQWPNN